MAAATFRGRSSLMVTSRAARRASVDGAFPGIASPAGTASPEPPSPDATFSDAVSTKAASPGTTSPGSASSPDAISPKVASPAGTTSPDASSPHETSPDVAPEPAGEGPARVHPSMQRKLFWAFFALAALILTACVVAAALLMQRSIISASEHELLQECAAIGAALNASDDPEALAQALASDGSDDTRLTLIEPDGTVVYDSRHDADQLGNHADRPEVRDALEGGTGSSVRSSSTLSQVLLYGAQRLDDGRVLRLSLTRSGALGSLVDLLPVAAIILLALVALCYAVSRVLARRLVAPLDSVDPSHPLANGGDAYVELMPLLRRMDEQRRQIDEQVLRLNDNDRMRDELTANVTHELKTPLTSISGYAELIETGLAAPADVPEFARRIHGEAQHLTSLVNDILTLSKMDEAERVDGALGTCEPVDLSQVAQSVVGRLGSRAADADVTFVLVGTDRPANAMGMPKLIDQIVYNLCDNATRYNRPGGTVTVTCGVAQDGRPYVSVADTGIGIAPENLEKVFARFYRVDASRSRQTGGTGLGLAIVKHAARCHDARLDISSELGVGTTITVSFHDAKDSAWLKSDGTAPGTSGTGL